MYDLSKMVYVEESSAGFAVKMTKVDGRSVYVDFHPFDSKEHRELTKFRAEVAAGHLMNNILDILEEVSGKELEDQQIQVVKIDR